MTVQPAQMANAIRFLSADGVQKANSGHPGMPLGMADVATVLFTKFMKVDPKNPKWFDRDRFVLSAGHGSMLLYSLAYLLGYEDIDKEQLMNFRQMGAKTAGHPEYGHVSMADTTTGPLGQGLTNVVGMALAEKMMRERYGADVCDHYSYTMAGDGCLMEGVSQEAISLAGHLKLGRMIMLWDDNEICIDGDTSKTTSDDMCARFQASGWETYTVDGHDFDAIEKAIAAARETDKPSLIDCKTIIGQGAPTLAGSEKTHGAPLGAEELQGMRDKLGWPHEPFDIPDDVLNAWREAGARNGAEFTNWKGRADQHADTAEFKRTISGELPGNFDDVVNAFKKQNSADAPTIATRKASQNCLSVLVPAVPEMVGGSADLTHSNLTIVDGMTPVTRDDASGNYVHWGVREHGMGSAINGMALHGGLRPYGATFFVFADYYRPAIRMQALMGAGTVHVLTHDSIGLGEDGPTHQPIEHLASYRAMPNVNMCRPADVIETMECWALGMQDTTRPTLLALTRQGLPTLRTEHTDENLCKKGAYVLAEADGDRKVTILATGSEVSLAMEARETLQADGVPTAVVSMPCWRLFDEQDDAYRASVLGDGVRISVEAGATFGWERYTGDKGANIGMTTFGASAPAAELYEHFGITAAAVVAAAKARV